MSENDNLESDGFKSPLSMTNDEFFDANDEEFKDIRDPGTQSKHKKLIESLVSVFPSSTENSPIKEAEKKSSMAMGESISQLDISKKLAEDIKSDSASLEKEVEDLLDSVIHSPENDEQAKKNGTEKIEEILKVDEDKVLDDDDDLTSQIDKMLAEETRKEPEDLPEIKKEDIVESVMEDTVEPVKDIAAKLEAKSSEESLNQIDEDKLLAEDQPESQDPISIDANIKPLTEDNDIDLEDVILNEEDNEILKEIDKEEIEILKEIANEDNELIDDELLVDCPSPKPAVDIREQESNKESTSETSSMNGDAQEESDFEKPAARNCVVEASTDTEDASKSDENEEASKSDENEEATKLKDDNEKPEEMEVDQTDEVKGGDDVTNEAVNLAATNEGILLVDATAELEAGNPSDEVRDGRAPRTYSEATTSSEVTTSSEATTSSKEQVPFKFTFLRKFSSKVGKLTRSELEEILIEKITESLAFKSDNSELRRRIEKQEKITEALKKQLESVKKQYNDLEMIHNRTMKDLKERPGAAITPVKITRAVGLQVYQPGWGGKKINSNISLQPTNKRSHEAISPVSGNNTTPPDAKRKKPIKFTPLRPPLSFSAQAQVARQEANEEQRLRTNVKNALSVPSGITVYPINGSSPNKSTSIDLTDDLEDKQVKKKVPPPLTTIRIVKQYETGKIPITSQAFDKPKTPVVLRQSIWPQNVAQLPAIFNNQLSQPHWKRIPPKPTIRITKQAPGLPPGIIVSWHIEDLNSLCHASISKYQIYAYEQTSAPPATSNWRAVGDVAALDLPMAVTLTQFQEGRKYFFAVRAVDCHKRFSAFSMPQSW